jgi:hypothetical protein
MRTYFTLFTFQARVHQWAPQFGDFSRAVVKQEMADSYKGETCYIAEHPSEQRGADEALRLLQIARPNG